MRRPLSGPAHRQMLGAMAVLTVARPGDAVTGIAWKVVSAMIFTAMLTIVKLIGDRIPVGEMLFARNFFGLIPVLA